MTTNEIRTKFLEFFKSKGHSIVTSDSVVPKDDPTVLFTTAGMQQFKRQFLGHIDGYTRAATSQKCMRTDDLDQVGRTDFHHTFFEMLGNFSFGDYFKKDAIFWAWEFFTQVLKIPSDRLWISVNKEDAEAKAVWLNEIKINPKKMFELGDKSNFWPSNARLNGPNGPCGPCSEIFFDYDPSKGTFPKDPDDEPGRFCEVWNLVFTQYNRKDGGELEPLPSKNIDTGMGLERLVAVLQGKKNNFETDLFALILKSIDQYVGKLENKERNNRYVIADHIRGIVFGINDGVIPSNEGRGYVIKKLIIDATDIVLLSGKSEPAVYKLVPSVVEAMKAPYPELEKKSKDIQEIVKKIEESYIKVRKERIPEFLIQIHRDVNNPEALGEAMFTFRDTYGLTLPTMKQELLNAKVNQNTVDAAIVKFNLCMEQQQNQSRSGSKMTGDVFTNTDLKLDVSKTEFTGYEHADSNSKVLAVIKDNASVKKAGEGDEIKIVLDKTPFYAESGGQIGDTGIFKTSSGIIRITDTQKRDDIFFHSGKITKGTLSVNDTVQTQIDVDRRLSIMRNHTATHLLQSALKKVLGSHIQQQGSLVDENRLRFDFTHPKAISADETAKIEFLVNTFIRACDVIAKEVMPIEKAKETGALAYFAEKYGSTVRVVSVENYSKEFCGGTHLGSTGQIGIFKIIGESAIAQGIRRIEAQTGIGALKSFKENEIKLEEIASILRTTPQDAAGRVRQLSDTVKELEREMENVRLEVIKKDIDITIKNLPATDGINIISQIYNNFEMETLRKASDYIKQKVRSSIIILGAKSDKNASILVTVSDDAVQKGFKANELITRAALLIDGKGGGRPQQAQAGGKNTDKVEQAVNDLKDFILKEKIKS